MSHIAFSSGYLFHVVDLSGISSPFKAHVFDYRGTCGFAARISHQSKVRAIGGLTVARHRELTSVARGIPLRLNHSLTLIP